MVESKTLEALFPGPRRPILLALLTEPDKQWSLPELAGRAGIQPSTARQHVVQLREAGIVREFHDDGKAVYQANPDMPVYPELRSIVTKLMPASDGGETILIVEDQPATAQITRILLESWGYHVLEAHDARHAIRIFEEHGPTIRLLLTDVIMPEITGPQLADELLERAPDLRVLFMSGYPGDQLSTRADAAFLPKPFNPASLSRMVRKELDRPAHTRQMKSS